MPLGKHSLPGLTSVEYQNKQHTYKMTFKIFAIIAFVCVASVTPSALYSTGELRTIEEHNPHPQYTFTYGVNDIISGDSKSQIETRDGDVVRGEYALNDADGFRRTVKYTADAVNGFNAVVDRKPIVEEAPVVVKSVAPVVDPVIVKAVAPVTYNVPSLIKSVPLTYSTPSLIKSAPVTYTTPTFIKSVPSGFVSKPVFNPTFAYSAGPSVFRSIPLSYAAPTAYFGSDEYTLKALKSFPRAF